MITRTGILRGLSSPLARSSSQTRFSKRCWRWPGQITRGRLPVSPSRGLFLHLTRNFCEILEFWTTEAKVPTPRKFAIDFTRPSDGAHALRGFPAFLFFGCPCNRRREVTEMTYTCTPNRRHVLEPLLNHGVTPPRFCVVSARRNNGKKDSCDCEQCGIFHLSAPWLLRYPEHAMRRKAAELSSQPNREMLLDHKLPYRAFRVSKYHLGRFTDDELRKVLVRAGCIRLTARRTLGLRTSHAES